MICMKNANSKTSSGKDKAKEQIEKKENPIRENENNSIYRIYGIFGHKRQRADGYEQNRAGASWDNGA